MVVLPQALLLLLLVVVRLQVWVQGIGLCRTLRRTLCKTLLGLRVQQSPLLGLLTVPTMLSLLSTAKLLQRGSSSAAHSCRSSSRDWPSSSSRDLASNSHSSWVLVSSSSSACRALKVLQQLQTSLLVMLVLLVLALAAVVL
jgi:hypothetical protein